MTAEPQKILLIDDDPLVGQLLGMLVATFQEAPSTLEHVRDYAGGLEHLLSGAYAVCLLDYRLGEGDGLQLLKEATTRHCPTPIIFLTGDSREETDIAAAPKSLLEFGRVLEDCPGRLFLVTDLFQQNSQVPVV